MKNEPAPVVTAVEAPLSSRFSEWIQDPMGGVIAASVATMGSLGIVIAGSWFIHIIIN